MANGARSMKSIMTLLCVCESSRKKEKARKALVYLSPSIPPQFFPFSCRLSCGLKDGSFNTKYRRNDKTVIKVVPDEEGKRKRKGFCVRQKTDYMPEIIYGVQECCVGIGAERAGGLRIVVYLEFNFRVNVYTFGTRTYVRRRRRKA